MASFYSGVIAYNCSAKLSLHLPMFINFIDIRECYIMFQGSCAESQLLMWSTLLIHELFYFLLWWSHCKGEAYSVTVISWVSDAFCNLWQKWHLLPNFCTSRVFKWLAFVVVIAFTGSCRSKSPSKICKFYQYLGMSYQSPSDVAVPSPNYQCEAHCLLMTSSIPSFCCGDFTIAQYRVLAISWDSDAFCDLWQCACFQNGIFYTPIFCDSKVFLMAWEAA